MQVASPSLALLREHKHQQRCSTIQHPSPLLKFQEFLQPRDLTEAAVGRSVLDVARCHCCLDRECVVRAVRWLRCISWPEQQGRESRMILPGTGASQGQAYSPAYAQQSALVLRLSHSFLKCLVSPSLRGTLPYPSQAPLQLLELQLRVGAAAAAAAVENFPHLTWCHK